MENEKIYQMDFSKVYHLLVSKAEKKGRTRQEVDQVIRWLTGYSQPELEGRLERPTPYGDFFRSAPELNENRRLIKGTVCGVRVEEIKETLMQEIRYLDKLVDELARGEYMLYGGLPPVMNISSRSEKVHFLKLLFEETYISDIVGRHNVRNRAELEELLNILSSAIGSLTNPTKLSAAFKSVKQKTISNDQLEETHAMENMIFNELKIHGFNVNVGVITLNKTNEKGHGIRRQLEIDFVCNKGSKRYYIQSAYVIPDRAKMEQEQRSLMLTGDFFKKIIIMKDAPAPYYNDDGVLVLSVYDFLLDEGSLNN